MKKRNFFLGALLVSASIHAEEIQHRFIAMDESRSQLHYVDQFDSAKDWTIKFPGRYRDVQLLGDRVMISTFNGYEEYDFQTLEKVKSVADPKFSQTETVIRLPNGHTLLGCNVAGGVRFFELENIKLFIKNGRT